MNHRLMAYPILIGIAILLVSGDGSEQWYYLKDAHTFLNSDAG